MAKYLEVLTPQNSQIIFIDQQPQMAFGVHSRILSWGNTASNSG
jgi:hypothetical protein